jgi:predicted Zn-ribbon and HTH transcriptional regulator
MKKKPKEPFVPVVKQDTIRHEILALLKEQELSAKEISTEVRISEAEVLDHLEHIRVMIRKEKAHIVVTPAACKKCGFVFKKRDRLTKPGKCPLCRCEQIREPRFVINPTFSSPQKSTKKTPK